MSLDESISSGHVNLPCPQPLQLGVSSTPEAEPAATAECVQVESTESALAAMQIRELNRDKIITKQYFLDEYKQKYRCLEEEMTADSEPTQESGTFGSQAKPVISKSLPHWEEWHGKLLAVGDRDAIIITSFGEAAARNDDVVPRSPREPTEEDDRGMMNQGLSSDECIDDMSILQARLKLDKSFEVVEMLVSDGVNRGHIMERLESRFKATEKTGITVYYLGHGKKDTGDWCFQDGFITFRNIAELYSCHLRGRVLTIIADCSHSGSWVNACLDYLDERGVRPCGHSAKERGILIKVYSSCRPEERAATNSFFVQAATNDPTSGALSYFTGKALSESQHCYGVGTTVVGCKKGIEEPCALLPEFNWKKWREGERVYRVRGKDHGRDAWYFVLLDDDPENIKNFKLALDEDIINLEKYGKILESGFGSDPPQKVADKISRTYKGLSKEL